MSRYTVLNYVQIALSAIESDTVNSIDDTPESQEIAQIVKRCYYDIADPAELPNNETLFQLTASGDDDLPTLMTKPDAIVAIKMIKYNVETLDDTDMLFREVGYMSPVAFLQLVHAYGESETDVGTYTYTIDGTNHTLMYRDDKAPEWWTSFDDETILFDSYDSDVDTTLQSSKTQCLGEVSESFDMSDSYVPPLNVKQQQLLLNEVISTSFAELKQAQNTQSERKARKGWVALQKNKRQALYRLPEIHKMPNFGRKGPR